MTYEYLRHLSYFLMCRILLVRYTVPTMNNSANLLIRKENYRLWFEFYKLCKQSKKTHIQINLEKLEDFYNSWGEVTTVKFDAWWKTHQHLFNEPMIKVLPDISMRQTADSLLIEVPLNQSTSAISITIKQIIETHTQMVKRKRTKRFTGTYSLSENSQPKLDEIREVLNFYKDVYLPNARISMSKLYPFVKDYYAKKKRELPHSLDDRKNSFKNVIRNLLRWKTKGDAYMENVSKGVFPGKVNG